MKKSSKKTFLTRFIPGFVGFSLAAAFVVRFLPRADSLSHTLPCFKINDTYFVKTRDGLARIKTILSEEETPVRVLQIKGAYESATYLDENRYTPVFAYQRAFDHLFEADLPTHNLLMIGGGGYAWPKHVMACAAEQQLEADCRKAAFKDLQNPNKKVALKDLQNPNEKTTSACTKAPVIPACTKAPVIPCDLTLEVVELDPAITAIARKWFFLDKLLEDFPTIQNQITCITAEGRSYLNETTKRYGAIINDTFSGKSPVLCLASIEAMQLVKQRLVPGGVYATNVVSEQEGFDISFLRRVATTLQEVFSYVYLIPCEDADFGLEDNYLVLASDRPYSFTNTMAYDDDFLSSPLHDDECTLS